MSQTPPPEKPKAIDILAGRRTRKTIAIGWSQGDSKFDLDERDNPLPSLVQALDALNPFVAEVLHVPTSWCETNLRVIGVIFGDQGGAGSFQLVCRKSLEDASKEFAFTTPPRLLAHPDEPGSYTPPVSKECIEAIETAREEFKSYVKGDRAQGLIAFGDEEGEEEDNGEYSKDEPLLQEDLPTVAEIVKPKRGRKAKSEPVGAE